MRNAFADEILKLALADERIVVLSGDIGNRLFDKFKEAMPTRFYNCGVAEANIISHKYDDVRLGGVARAAARPVIGVQPVHTTAARRATRCTSAARVPSIFPARWRQR